MAAVGASALLDINLKGSYSESIPIESSHVSRAFGVPDRLECMLDLLEDCWVVDRGWHLVLLGVGHLLHDAAQNLPRTRLGEAPDHRCVLECRDGADPLAHHLYDVAHDLTVAAIHALP